MTHLSSKLKYRFLQVFLKAVNTGSTKIFSLQEELQLNTEASRCSFYFAMTPYVSHFHVVGTLLDIAQVCLNKIIRI